MKEVFTRARKSSPFIFKLFQVFSLVKASTNGWSRAEQQSLAMRSGNFLNSSSHFNVHSNYMVKKVLKNAVLLFYSHWSRNAMAFVSYYLILQYGMLVKRIS